jgi:hypothetical protein
MNWARIRFRIRIRTLLIVVAIFAPILAGLGLLFQAGEAFNAFYFPKDRPIRKVPPAVTPPGATMP